jgi:hypothetical protein
MLMNFRYYVVYGLDTQIDPLIHFFLSCPLVIISPPEILKDQFPVVWPP